MGVFEIISKYQSEFLTGVWVTTKMTLMIWLIGIIVGTLLGILVSKYRLFVGIPVGIATYSLGSIPIVVLLFWMHYPLQELLGVVVPGYYTTIFTLSVINIFMVANLVGATLSNFPKNLIVSAEVCGFSKKEIVAKVQIPLILRQILPSILIIQVTMMHATLFGSLISVDEIFRIAQRVNSEVYQPVEVYSTLAIFFLGISAPLTATAYWLEKKYKVQFAKY